MKVYNHLDGALQVLLLMFSYCTIHFDCVTLRYSINVEYKLHEHCRVILQKLYVAALTVHQCDGVWKETVLVSGCFGAQCSLAPTRGLKLK